MSTSRSGMPWTTRETTVLVNNHNKGRSYSSIAAMKIFNGRRSVKALRRRFERVVLGHGS